MGCRAVTPDSLLLTYCLSQSVGYKLPVVTAQHPTRWKTSNSCMCDGQIFLLLRWQVQP